MPCTKKGLVVELAQLKFTYIAVLKQSRVGNRQICPEAVVHGTMHRGGKWPFLVENKKMQS